MGGGLALKWEISLAIVAGAAVMLWFDRNGKKLTGDHAEQASLFIPTLGSTPDWYGQPTWFGGGKFLF